MPTNERRREHTELVERLKAQAAAAGDGRGHGPYQGADIDRRRATRAGRSGRHADHLSDRELYTQLVREILPEEMAALDGNANSAWHVDVLGYDNPELYLKYYADERARESWRRQFPHDPMPARGNRPFIGTVNCPSLSASVRTLPG